MTLRGIAAAVLVLLAVVGGLAGRPAAGAPPGPADYVIVAGSAGLRWDDLDPVRTPTLWQTASRGAIGWLSVRSAHRPTCPLDGWLTLGAGNYAAWDAEPADTRCSPAMPLLQRPDGIGANLPDQRQVVRENQARSYGAVPGALAESVRCTVAVGPGAAVAAARPFGRVDRYEPRLPADPAPLLSDCVLSIVDLGTVAGDGAIRRRAVARADATLARVLAGRPARSLVLVAGLADTETVSRLHVAIADGPGWQGGWLTSAGTGRDGYVRLVDLAPTVLSALGRAAPQRLFVGKSASRVPGRPNDLAQAVSGEYDADRRAGAQRDVAGPFFVTLAVVQLLLFGFVVPLLVRARRHAGPTGPASPPRHLLRAAELLLVAAALVVPAALVADAVPWWRAGWPGVLFSVITALLVVAGTAAVRLAPGYARTLQPMALVAAIGAAVVVIDLLTGARLQLNGVAGYS
ncbi:MAG TPA: hypothetical protein VFO77_07745, partial [Actinoplanes sp.]|nr:hypothetical protein [Actinoplanes sp.]